MFQLIARRECIRVIVRPSSCLQPLFIDRMRELLRKEISRPFYLKKCSYVQVCLHIKIPSHINIDD